jgi:hypothetical protein
MNVELSEQVVCAVLCLFQTFFTLDTPRLKIIGITVHGRVQTSRFYYNTVNMIC